MRTYVNKVPIDDDLTVLDLLYGSRGFKDNALIHTKKETYVVLDENDRATYFLVAPDTADYLKAHMLVVGTPHWGYTDEKHLRISPSGEARLYKRWNGIGGIPVWPNQQLRAEYWFRGLAC